MADVLSVTECTTTWAAQRQITVACENKVDSTSDWAKTAAFKEDSDFVVYLTAHQTNGRGRGTHEWLDTGSGENLLTTWSLKMNSPPQAITGPRVGLALYQAAQKTWPSLNWSLKAPNDLLLAGLKTAGLLIETVTHGDRHRLLIGLGFNVLNFPRLLSEATSLSEALGASPDEGDWFRFLDEYKGQVLQAANEITESRLSEGARQRLAAALNANPLRPFEVKEVSAHGDLLHAGGQVSWTAL